jgi:5,5'-dehydrodivanillate O-demethylase
LEGESEDSDEWTVGHPLIFPNLLAVGSQRAASLQFRIAIDDTNTVQFGYRTSPRKEGAEPKPMAVKQTNLFNSDGKITFDNVPAQDMVAWVAQGTISDRSEEHLGHSDKGLIMYHRLLQEQMDKVARGEEPMALIRDRSENEPMVVLNRERNRYSAFDPQYPNYFEKVRETADIKEH